MSTKKPLDKKNVEDIFALSPLQQGMLFHTLHSPDDNLYAMQLNIKLSGQIRESVIREAWRVMTECHPVLRTTYRWKKNDHPVQIVLRSHEISFHFFDLSVYETAEQQNRLEAFIQSDRLEQFDLEDCPFRVTLLKLRDDHYQMVISNHHILSDGWSLSLLIKEFWRTYQALFRGDRYYSEEKGSFKTYIKYLRNQTSGEAELFWKQYLADAEESTALPMTRHIHRPQQGTTRSIYVQIPGNTLNEINLVAKRYHVPVSAIYYTAWGLLLHRLTGKNAVFGTTVSGRSVPVAGVQSIMGVLINTIPLHMRFPDNCTIIDAVLSVRDALSGRVPYETTPLVDIRSWSGLKNNEELFRSIVVVENYPVDQEMNDSDVLRIESVSEYSSSNYDLSVVIMGEAELTLEFKYNDQLFCEASVKKLGQWMERMLHEIICHTEQEINRLDLLTTEEKEQLLYGFNDTRTAYPKEKTISELFEEQAAAGGERIALVEGGRQWSYAELNARANRVARKLREQGVGPERMVGILCERSLEMTAGLLGILKAGGAYLPIDPGYPLERIAYMLEDSGSSWLLSAGGWPEGLSFAGERIELTASLL
ncbi:condensation domain-containing protein, partial [Paenibacillus pinihumi]|uniref:condensation domain-containing protein n=1 Tax=Paenibacillus pinihumi TaxID=669462 RepID=UPI00055F9A08